MPFVAFAIFVPDDSSLATACEKNAIQLNYQTLEVPELRTSAAVNLYGSAQGFLLDLPHEPYRAFYLEKICVTFLRLKKVEIVQDCVKSANAELAQSLFSCRCLFVYGPGFAPGCHGIKRRCRIVHFCRRTKLKVQSMNSVPRKHVQEQLPTFNLLEIKGMFVVIIMMLEFISHAGLQ